MAIVMVFSIINAPTQEEIRRQKAIQDSIAAITPPIVDTLSRDTIKPVVSATELQQSIDSLAQLTVESDSVKQADSLVMLQELTRKKTIWGAFYNLVEGQERLIKVENDKMIIYFTTNGAYPKKVILKEYQTYYGDPLVIYDPDSSLTEMYFFTSEGKEIHTADLYFEPSVDSILLSGNMQKDITFKAKNAKGETLEWTYTIKGNDYMIESRVKTSDWQKLLDSRAPYIYLTNYSAITPKEKYLKNQQMASTIYFKYKGEDVDYLSETSSEDESPDASVQWVAIKDQFFSVIFLDENYFDKYDSRLFVIHEENSIYAKKMGFQLTKEIKNAQDVFETKIYFGPNHFQTLKKYGYEFERIIPLGWAIIGWVNRFLVIPIFNFLESFHLNYGIIILILTLIIKTILFPITYRNYVSAAKMRVIKPEIQEINQKYEKDPMKKQQAIMELYRRTGVNPLAGCIPMLLQLPILYAMFRFFPASIELRQEKFLWADDLSTYDSIYDLPFNIPFYGDHISLFTILMALSIYFYTKVNSSQMDTGTNDIMAQQMKIMMYIMPVMMLFFFNNFPAGLNYYYFIANVTSILQTVIIRKWVVNEESIRRKIEENKKRPVKKSSWQKRLEEMAKQREQQRKK